jgi:hypothetical protein
VSACQASLAAVTVVPCVASAPSEYSSHPHVIIPSTWPLETATISSFFGTMLWARLFFPNFLVSVFLHLELDASGSRKFWFVESFVSALSASFARKIITSFIGHFTSALHWRLCISGSLCGHCTSLVEEDRPDFIHHIVQGCASPG